MKSLTAYLILVAIVAAERLVELWLSHRNAKYAFARGAVEYGQTHYRVMVIFHVAFLLSCVSEAIAFGRIFPGLIGWISLAALIAAEMLRYSAIFALGERWNTRIIVIPGAAPVVGGPYRFLRHPNYVAVAIELAALPMIRGCWLTAIVFSLGNLMLMLVRIPAEESAMGADYRAAFSHLPRFWPQFGSFLRQSRRAPAASKRTSRVRAS